MFHKNLVDNNKKVFFYNLYLSMHWCKCRCGYEVKMASDYPDYVKQDFDQGEISFLFRSYNPLENRHCKYFKQNEVKEEVLKSPKLRTLISDVSKNICI